MTSLLGRIVSGEAATPAGQQAVLNVIQNRAAVNFGGYGTTLEAQATAPYQFSAYPNALGASSPQTENLVGAAQEGSLGNIVPNSYNYANPSLTSAQWVQNAYASGQGVNVGGEGNVFFANSQGGSPGYDPSQLYNATSPAAATGSQGPISVFGFASGPNGDANLAQVGNLPNSLYGQSSVAPQSGPFSTDYGFSGSGLDGPQAGSVGTGSASLNYAPQADPGTSGGTGDLIPYSPAPANDGLTTTNATPSPIPGGSPASGSTSSPTTSFLDKTGQPVNVTDISAAGSQAGGQIQSGLTAAAGQLATADTSLVGSLESAATDLTIRGGLLLVGLALIAGAYVFYAKDGGHGQSALPA